MPRPRGVDYVETDHGLGEGAVAVVAGNPLPEQVIVQRTLEEVSGVLEDQPVGPFDDDDPRLTGIFLMGDAVVERFQDHLCVVLLQLDGHELVEGLQAEPEVADPGEDLVDRKQKRRAEVFIGLLFGIQLPGDLGDRRRQPESGFRTAQEEQRCPGQLALTGQLDLLQKHHVVPMGNLGCEGSGLVFLLELLSGQLESRGIQVSNRGSETQLG